MRLEAHAKLNLTLEVLGKRPDGYHNLVSVMQTIDLHDEIELEESDEISLDCDVPELSNDDNLAVKAAKALLTKKGHDVRVVGVVKSAFTRIEGEPFDLIVMDLNLPDLRGDDAIETIRNQMNLKVPIIVLSGEIKPEVVLRLKPLGISAFVTKSADFVLRLSEEVDKALSEQLSTDT